jgi:nucleoside-diphosphate-sugar epimerase
LKIFLTGGTGFIGSYFLNLAFAAGHNVIALRSTAESKPNIKITREPLWVNKLIEDLTPEDLSGCDVVVHLASFGVSPKPSTWDDCFKVNVMDTMHLLKIANVEGVRGVIAAGSYAEYGSAGLHYDFIPVDAPLEPKGAYASSKAAASIAIRSFTESVGMSLIYGRIFSAFGEGQFEKNLWPSLKKSAIEGSDFEMTPGEQIRDFIRVEDVAGWFIQALEHISLQKEISSFWNVASGNPISIREFCENWWQKFEAKGKLLVGALQYRDAEVMRYVPEVKTW